MHAGGQECRPQTGLKSVHFEREFHFTFSGKE